MSELFRAVNRELWRRRMAGEGYVYVAEEVGTGIIKIGFSLDPERRMDALRLDYRRKYRLMGFVRGSNALEKRIHSWLWRRIKPAHGFEFYRRDDLTRVLPS